MLKAPKPGRALAIPSVSQAQPAKRKDAPRSDLWLEPESLGRRAEQIGSDFCAGLGDSLE